jgi:hypothetical protein
MAQRCEPNSPKGGIASVGEQEIRKLPRELIFASRARVSGALIAINIHGT